jgi:transketolase
MSTQVSVVSPVIHIEQLFGMRTFGASAPLKQLQRKFGFGPERLVATAKQLLGTP